MVQMQFLLVLTCGPRVMCLIGTSGRANLYATRNVSNYSSLPTAWRTVMLISLPQNER